MNQQECKEEAERLLEYVRTGHFQLYSDSYRNLVLRAQVYATLATIPDPPSRAGTGPL